MQIKNLDHIVIVVSDVKKALKFYCDILGMRPAKKDGHISLNFGSQKINLHRFEGEFCLRQSIQQRVALIYV
ncbi:VOC family protein [Campylobacter concisus]|uniref:VOC family protein n=1 Tax=Campylobacter concisus TaxID=199 RepID=UPI001900B1CE|nr:VOC family protein [Campylobacter concisus]